MRRSRRDWLHEWLWRLGVGAASMTCAVVFTHVLWRFIKSPPLVFGFGAAIVSTRIGGRKTGFLAVIIGVSVYATFPPPWPESGFGRLLFGFAVIAGTISWLVARRY